MDADAAADGIEGGETDASELTLVDLLDLLERKRINIVLVGGDGVAGNGEFVFAIEHAEGDTRTADLRDELEEAGYRVGKRLVQPAFRWLPDNVPGALLAAVRDVTGERSRADEVLVGVLPDGRAFCHIRTVR